MEQTRRVNGRNDALRISATEMRPTQGRIAVIEDDLVLQQLMYALLTDEGYEVVGWRWARGAHAMIRRAHPDAVLLDLRLEDEWSGLRLAEELRHDPATTDMPLVAMSGDHRFLREHREDLERLGCDIEAMPFDLADLLATVERCIDAR
jgi:DNA-binding NtrC family response regulator